MSFIKNELTMSIAKRKCSKCGVTIVFYQPYPCICKNCGTKVYPTKKMEVIEKIKEEMKKR